MSISDRVFEEKFDRLSNADQLAVLDIRRKLRSDFYDDPNWIFQHYRGEVSLSDAYGFTVIWSRLAAGKILHVDIKVGHTPSPDRCVDFNQSKLRRLPHPFSASVWSDKEPGDGRLRWSEAIRLTRWETRDEDPEHDLYELEMRAADSVALEIGTTSAPTTWYHIFMRGGGVARWPYGSDYIRLFLRNEPHWTELAEFS